TLVGPRRRLLPGRKQPLAELLPIAAGHGRAQPQEHLLLVGDVLAQLGDELLHAGVEIVAVRPEPAERRQRFLAFLLLLKSTVRPAIAVRQNLPDRWPQVLLLR